MRYATDVQELVAMKLQEELAINEAEAWEGIDAAVPIMRLTHGNHYSGNQLFDCAYRQINKLRNS